MIKEILQKKLSVALMQLGYPNCDKLILDKPKNADHGDYASNLAFLLAKPLKKSPKEIAQSLCDQLSSEFKNVYKFEAINGFSNIRLSDQVLWQSFQELLDKKPSYPVSKERYLLEYVSANPTGPLHIGHGRWAVLGAALANLLRYTNHNVKTEFYINDAGNQINKLRESVTAVKEGRDVPEDGYHGHYIHTLAQSDADPLDENLAHHRQVLDGLGVSFNTWFSEQSLHDSGAVEAVITFLKEKEVTYEEAGALWFKTTDYGDEKDRVLVKADGAYTYFVVDIAYHHHKLSRGFDTLINIWGADHHGYVARMKAALAVLTGIQEKNPLNVMIGQLVSLTRDGEQIRMSKRTGEMITLDEVIEDIGPDATRYFLVEKSPDTHVEFDLELAKRQSSDNPVYYIQYAHARLCSILKKCKSEGVQLSNTPDISKLNPKERQLILLAIQFYDEIWESALNKAPHKVAQYLYQLARYTHHFYETNPILKADPSDQQRRLYIITKIRSLLAECLTILDISAPESM